jgi:exodeoxyribonuclease VII large subunit
MDAALDSRLAHSSRLLEQLSLRLANAGEHRLRLAEQATERATAPLEQLGKMVGLRQEHKLSRLELRLNALDPYEPLKRGYAMALNEDGRFLRSVGQTAPGKRVTVELADGRLVTIVDAVEHGGKGAGA